MSYFLRIRFGKFDKYVKVTEDSFFKAVDDISEKYLVVKDSLVSSMGSKAVFYKAVDTESEESWDFGALFDQNISCKEISK